MRKNQTNFVKRLSRCGRAPAPLSPEHLQRIRLDLANMGQPGPCAESVRLMRAAMHSQRSEV